MYATIITDRKKQTHGDGDCATDSRATNSPDAVQGSRSPWFPNLDNLCLVPPVEHLGLAPILSTLQINTSFCENHLSRGKPSTSITLLAARPCLV